MSLSQNMMHNLNLIVQYIAIQYHETTIFKSVGNKRELRRDFLAPA